MVAATPDKKARGGEMSECENTREMDEANSLSTEVFVRFTPNASSATAASRLRIRCMRAPALT